MLILFIIFIITASLIASLNQPLTEDYNLIADDFIIFSIILVLFFYHLLIKNKSVLAFTRDLTLVYLAIIVVGAGSSRDFAGAIFNSDEDGICLLISIFGLFINFLLYIDIMYNDPKTHKLELPYLIALLT